MSKKAKTLTKPASVKDAFLEAANLELKRLFPTMRITKSEDEEDAWKVAIDSDDSAFTIYKEPVEVERRTIAGTRKVMDEQFFFAYDVLLRSCHRDEPDDWDTIESEKFKTFQACIVGICAALINERLNNCIDCDW